MDRILIRFPNTGEKNHYFILLKFLRQKFLTRGGYRFSLDSV